MKKLESEPHLELALSITDSNKDNDEEFIIDLAKNNENLKKKISNSQNNVPKEIKNLLERMDKKVCNVCLDEGEEDDDIFQCSSCYYSTHRWCYGSELIRNHDNFREWTCQKCKYIKDNLQNNDLIKCMFCPFKVGNRRIKKGIIKKINQLDWAHIVCVNWDENIRYLDATKEEINYLDINKEKFTLKCMFCKIRQGACIQCDITSCSKSFHVVCAIQRGLIKHWKMMELHKPMRNDEKLNEYQCRINIYCELHSSKPVRKRNNEEDKPENTTAKKSVINIITSKKFKNEENLKNIISEKQFKKNNEILKKPIILNGSSNNKIKNFEKEYSLDYYVSEKKNRIENEIIDLTNKKEEETQLLKKKLTRKEEKVLVKPELGRLLGIYYPIKFEELLIEMNKFLKINQLLDKNDQYIYVQKNDKLKDLLKCEIIGYSLLHTKLESLVEKIDSKKQKADNSSIKEDNIISKVKNSLSDYKEKGNEIKKVNNSCNINIKTIHSNEIIKKRAFFVKENALKLFKF